ncbi:MAG: hypothetical protein LIP03_09300 [Bacteroidales bacterium]|nr:hypothetical protein [Bacteroidales bacterium]
MTVFAILVAVAALIAALMKMKRDLMMLQQNSYRNDRFRHWMAESKDSTSMVNLVGWVIFFLCLLAIMPHWLGMTLVGLFASWVMLRLGTEHYKKPLVWTARAKRIYGTTIFLVAATLLIPIFAATSGGVMQRFFNVAVFLVFVFCCAAAYMLAANWLLGPVERRINKKYYDEAAKMLRSMPDLKVIGITGSYGKTSTKHYLNRILSEQFDVLMTPGNFNTTLGVIRTVREQMKPYNEIFIAEMGAKQRGDIKEICDLVHPQIGIITAVGPQHLESFGTIENVQRTKFELADALPADGLAVVNNDFEPIAERKVDNVECLRYSTNPDAGADYYASDIQYTPQGTTFAIYDKDGKKVIDLHTRLVGSCNVSNLVAAVIVALRLGMNKDKIRYAVENIEQVEHRLSMKRTPAGITIIDDAYNSNPVGSKMALEVLAGMKGGKRIIITPGMVELGQDQEELNRKFGEEIARSVDVAIVVGEYNRKAIVEGFNAAAAMLEEKPQLIEAATFAEAQQEMLKMAKAGDTVLYENDLPDTFK